MSGRKYEVRFAVDEHPDPETETVTVEADIVDEGTPKERAVLAAAEKSPYSHAETLAIQEMEIDG
jgi:hypothetical protein